MTHHKLCPDDIVHHVNNPSISGTVVSVKNHIVFVYIYGKTQQFFTNNWIKSNSNHK